MSSQKWSMAVLVTAMLLGTSCAGWLANGSPVDNGGNNPPPPDVVTKHAPSITAIAATPSSVAVGADTALLVTASDADGDTLSFAWSGGGTFGTASAATTTWSNDTAGTYTLTVTVTDPDALSTSGVVTVVVAVPTSGNNAPVFDADGVTSDVSAPVATQKVIFSATVTDPDGDPLNVTWDDGTGSANFSDASWDEATGLAQATWIAPAAGTSTITCDADDGKVGSRATSVTGTATLVVTVAELPTDFDVVGYETCNMCHLDKVTQWQNTNHHDALERTINSSPYGYRNESCYGCHAVGYTPTGSGGFIDQDLTPQFANIQCESCHGSGNPPGAGQGHKPRPWDPGMGYERDETGAFVKDGDGAYIYDAAYDGSQGYGCGLCHQGAIHGAFEQWASSGHATFPAAPLVEEGEVGPPGEVNCVKCHNGQYFVSIQMDGGDPPAENLAPEDMNAGMYISCATCHDPHESTNEKQLRVGVGDGAVIPWDDTAVEAGWGNICLRCHNGRRTRTDYTTQTANPGSNMRGPHGNAQGALFYGLMGADFGGAPVAYETDHPHRTWNVNTCISCHMFRRPYFDSANPALWGHDWKPVWENCTTCHATITDEATFTTYVEEFQAKIAQLQADFVAAWPAEWKDVTDPASPVLNFKNSAPGVDDGPYHLADGPLDAAQIMGNSYRECLWNYKLVNADATKGVHNPTFVTDLMAKTIARVEELNAAP